MPGGIDLGKPSLLRLKAPNGPRFVAERREPSGDRAHSRTRRAARASPLPYGPQLWGNWACAVPLLFQRAAGVAEDDF